MAQLREIVIDCTYPASLARFWADVLDDWSVRPYGDAEIERLMGLGATVLAEADTWTVMGDPEGNEFCVADQR